MAGTVDRRRRQQVESSRLASGLAVFGVAWSAVHAMGLLGRYRWITLAFFTGAALYGSVTVASRYQLRRRWPWALITGAFVLFLAGAVSRQAYSTLGDLGATRSPVPDLLTLPGYLLLAAGIAGFAQARRTEDDFDAVLDGTLAGLAALTLSWVYLINPSLVQDDVPLEVRVLLACYPPMSIFVFVVAIRTSVTARAVRSASFRYRVAALVCLFGGDVVYMLADARLVHLAPELVDLPYALAFVAFAAHALHPSVRDLCEPVHQAEMKPQRARLALVGLALVIPAVVVTTRQDLEEADRVVLSLIILTLTTVAMWRVLRVLHAHARSEVFLAHEATHDSLTGLANRSAIGEHLAHALDDARVGGGLVALLFIDVDRFKLVNDTLGHSVGDQLLRAVAGRLSATVRPTDLVARIGGDEFLVALDDVASVAEAEQVADRIRWSFRQPFEVVGGELFAAMSGGLVVVPGDAGVTPEVLIRNADTAMYQAKDAGRDGVVLFDDSMGDRVAERVMLERELRQAFGRGELEVHFQPLIDLRLGPAVGLETLLRWRHPHHGWISPVRFIPVAEESGLIVGIGAWVLGEALRYLALWRRQVEGAEGIHVAVNLSVRQLREPGVVEMVRGWLERYQLPGSALVLEITESVMIEDPDSAALVLGELRALGVSLAIDDFGTGYSSLAYLERFPVNSVKIDQSFVAGLDRAEGSSDGLVAAIVAMARALGLTTVAEGIETESQERRLEALGCDVAQGYLYARPMPPSEVPAALLRLLQPDERVRLVI